MLWRSDVGDTIGRLRVQKIFISFLNLSLYFFFILSKGLWLNWRFLYTIVLLLIILWWKFLPDSRDPIVEFTFYWLNRFPLVTNLLLASKLLLVSRTSSLWSWTSMRDSPQVARPKNWANKWGLNNFSFIFKA
jgi:hypothetical protein